MPVYISSTECQLSSTTQHLTNGQSNPRLSKSLQSPPKNRNVFRLRGSPTLRAGRMHFVGFASLQRPYNVPPRSLAVNVAITTFLINANTTRGAGQGPGESVGWRGAARRGDGDADLVPYAQECCPDGSLAPSLSRCRHLHGYTPRPACLLAQSTLHSTTTVCPTSPAAMIHPP